MARGHPSINGSVAASGLGVALRRVLNLALDVLLPHQCLRCAAVVETAGALCPGCWDEVAFLEPPFCQACGVPFEFDPGVDMLCAACVREPPVYERARAVVTYDEASRGLVLALKHGDRTDAAPAFGRWMVRAGGALVGDADVAVPVPLHWTRLFTRRYNQAALLAAAVARAARIPMAPDALVRRRRTPSQGKLNAARRRRNVRGAFIAHPRHRHLIEGRRVLLIDDMLTTGATVSACSRALLDAGARAVDVLTLARMVRPAL